jgi:hypothetical protein
MHLHAAMRAHLFDCSESAFGIAADANGKAEFAIAVIASDMQASA